MGYCSSIVVGILVTLAGGSHQALGNNSPDAHHADHKAMDKAAQHERWHAQVDLTPLSTDEAQTGYRVHLRIQDAEGNPIGLDHLMVVHTQPLHLLIIDEAFTDYHHIHPDATVEPGTYVFTWQPRTSNRYALWADVTDAKTGQQRFIRLELLAAKKGDSTANSQFTKEMKKTQLITSNLGVTAKLHLAEALEKNKATLLKLELTDQTGQPLQDLEPLMGAFAHLVGFYQDFQTLAHVHPMGDEPQTSDARGASPLSFRLEPEVSGDLHLFLQIKRQGQEITFPFRVRIQ